MGINFFRRQAPEAATERKASVTGRIAAMATGYRGNTGVAALEGARPARLARTCSGVTRS